jgi:hypothetical protein
MLWSKRNQIFGEDVAKEIWAGELKAQETKTIIKTDRSISGDINDKVPTI